MYDLSKEFKKFYENKVVLPAAEKTKLRDKKKLNIDRLESGLDEYNEENNKSYEVVETREQGSVAMSTVTQNDSNDYDIESEIQRMFLWAISCGALYAPARWFPSVRSAWDHNNKCCFFGCR